MMSVNTSKIIVKHLLEVCTVQVPTLKLKNNKGNEIFRTLETHAGELKSQGKMSEL